MWFGIWATTWYRFVVLHRKAVIWKCKGESRNSKHNFINTEGWISQKSMKHDWVHLLPLESSPTQYEFKTLVQRKRDSDQSETRIQGGHERNPTWQNPVKWLTTSFWNGDLDDWACSLFLEYTVIQPFDPKVTQRWWNQSRNQNN